MQAFTDLVGTSVVPAHCFDSTELTDLTPALDTATAAHDMAEQASEASGTWASFTPTTASCFDSDELTDLTPALDAAASIQEDRDASGAAYTNMGSPICRHHNMAEQASEAAASTSMMTCTPGCGY